MLHAAAEDEDSGEDETSDSLDSSLDDDDSFSCDIDYEEGE